MAYGNRGGYPQRGGRGSYGGNRRGASRSGGRGANRSDTRLTGLFATKRDGLYVGSATGEQLDQLIAKIKEARTAGRGVTFFLWKNDFGDGGPPFSLNCDVERERSSNADPRMNRRIDETDEDLPEEEDTEDLFGTK